jgi:phosphoribosylaminoimidazolecarboxamide formyltransferase/IMP cyclohydrolase
LRSIRTIDVATANELNSLFFEVLTAPDYEEEALSYFERARKNRILLAPKISGKDHQSV